jgi:hypothetical protein
VERGVRGCVGKVEMEVDGVGGQHFFFFDYARDGQNRQAGRKRKWAT